mgnify:FL=1
MGLEGLKKLEMSIKILHTNLGRGRAAHDIAYATAKHKEVDILIVCEPNKTLTKQSEWVKDDRMDAAVLFVNKKIIVSGVIRRKGYLLINLGEWDLYCCYISPNISMEEYTDKVKEIAECVSDQKREALIAGDINAKSPMWESPIIDAKGELWNEWIAALNLVPHNTGGKPTFVRGHTESYIDVTISTQRLAKQIIHWQVLEEENLTQHRFIYYEVRTDKVPRKMPEKKIHHIDWDVFKASLEFRVANLANEEMASHNLCTSIIKEAYKNSYKVGRNEEKRVPYWWNQSINDARKDCTKKRRNYTRMAKITSKTEEEKQNAKEEYSARKKELRKLIRQSKKECWNNLCEELNKDIWGQGYKIAIKGLRNLAPYEITDKQKKDIVKQLFPCPKNKTRNHRRRVQEAPLFTEAELEKAIEKMKTKKAPGLDGIPPEAIKETAKVNIKWLLMVLNQLLQTQTYPKEWKSAKVILIPKGKPNSYRPLCLLNTLSKLRIINQKKART